MIVCSTTSEIDEMIRLLDLITLAGSCLVADAADKTNVTGALHTCFICKTELCSRTRPIERSRAAQYGITEAEIPAGARICNSCQCKSVKSRYTHCPLPTCPNPKDRVKRFRNLPPRLFELAAEIRDPIVQELQIPPNVSKCCSACLTRIRRKMGPHLLGSTSLTDDEVNRLKKLLQEYGPKWNQFAETLSKPALAHKNFYFYYQKKYGLDVALNEYYKLHPSEDRRPAMTDGDESDLSAGSSSSDERDGGSDTTASAESPTSGNAGGSSASLGNVTVGTKGSSGNANDGTSLSEGATTTKIDEGGIIMLGGAGGGSNVSSGVIGNSSNNSASGVGGGSSGSSEVAISLAPPPKTTATITGSSSSTSSGGSGLAYEDERLLPPGQPQPRKPLRHTEEYDSSATETADEENESSPANRQSPKVSLSHPPIPHAHYPPPLHHSSGIAMLHNSINSTQQQSNGPRSNAIGGVAGGGSGGDLSSALNVRDVVLNVIERSLKNNSLATAGKPPPPGLRDLQFGSSGTPPAPGGQQQIQPGVPNSASSVSSSGTNASSTTSSMIRDYRDGTKVVLASAPGVSQSIAGIGSNVSSSQSVQQSNQLAMPVSSLGITVVNSHGQIIASPGGPQPHSSLPPPLVGGHVQLSHHHALGGQIPATITPIPHSIHLGGSSNLNSSVVRTPNDEPQTLDLSIKKTPRTEAMGVASAPPTKLVEVSNSGSGGGGGSFPPPPAHSHSNSNHLSGGPSGGSNGTGPSSGSNNNVNNKYHLGHAGPPPNSHGASVTVYRTDGAFSGPNIPSSSTVVGVGGGGPYVSYHPPVSGAPSDAMGRPLTKSPSSTGATYLSIPLGAGPGQSSGGISMQVPSGTGRQSTLSSLTPPPPLSGSGGPKGKNTPKLSPKLSGSGSVSGVPKGGSITHGTPVNVNQQQQQQQQTQLIIQGQQSSSATLSPRYENHLLRQTPPSSVASSGRPGASSSPVIMSDKFIGSITQGTPVHGGSGGLLPDKRSNSSAYDYKRQSPAQTIVVPGGGHVLPIQFSPYGAGVRGVSGGNGNGAPGVAAYSSLEPTSQQLSSRQIIMNDYITSQQMQGRAAGAGGSGPVGSSGVVPLVVNAAAGGRSGKESPLPRSVGGSSVGGPTPLSIPPGSIYGLVGSNVVGASPLGIVSSRQAQNDYLSRTSPAADHVNRISPVYSNTSSPHRTPPPPQRQGVIQRHNTSSNSGNSSGPGNGGSNSGNTGSVAMVVGGGSASSKPPSPAPRYHLPAPPPPHHYLQDAFTSFVDLAVQQPPMTVPHKDDAKRSVIDQQQQQQPSPTLSSGLAVSSAHHHDMRYQHPSMIPFHHQQQHHHQQQQAKQAAQSLAQSQQQQLHQSQQQQTQQQLHQQLQSQQHSQEQQSKAQLQEPNKLQSLEHSKQQSQPQSQSQAHQQSQNQHHQHQPSQSPQPSQPHSQHQQTKQSHPPSSMGQQSQQNPQSHHSAQQQQENQDNEQEHQKQQQQQHQKQQQQLHHLHQQQQQAAAAVAQHHLQLRQQQVDMQRRHQQQSPMHPSLQQLGPIPSYQRDPHAEQRDRRDELNFRERVEFERTVMVDRAERERDRERDHRDRERERERDRERERERDRDRERERERERERDRERDHRERRELEREQQARDQLHRDRERLDRHQEAEERRRKQQYEGFLPDRRDRTIELMGARTTSDGSLTAANLIDAIITHQISQTAVEPPPMQSIRDPHRTPYFGSRDQRSMAMQQVISENNGSKSHSPNVINVDLDSDSVHPHHRRDISVMSGNSLSGVKNITLGELTESIIAKDYSPNPNPYLSLRPPMMPYGAAPAGGAEALLAADHWKHRRPTSVAATSAKEEQMQQQQRAHEVQKGPGRVTPEDRHIIRLAQSPGPRSKFHESVSPDAQQFFHPGAPHLGRGVGGAGGGGPHAGAGGRDNFVLDFYVKNRIVEAMRTEDEKRASSDASMVVVVDGSSGGGNGNRNVDRQQSSPRSFQNLSPHPASAHHHVKDLGLIDRSGTPASGGSEGQQQQQQQQSHHSSVEEQKQAQQYPQHSTSSSLMSTSGSTTTSPAIIHSTYHQQPITTFTTPPTYAYPFSALTVASGAPPPTTSSSGHPSSSASSATTSISTTIGTGGSGSSSVSGMKSINSGMILSGSGPGVGGGNNSVGLNSAGGGSGPGGGVLTDDRHGGAPAMEPKPLLSAQYEALSDED